MSAPGLRQARVPWRAVDGVLLLDKPTGMSSNRALQIARRLFLAEKAGHTGTLDPLASGLLPICFGEATKFAGELLGADKRYSALVQLGVTTDTADAEGRVHETRPVTATHDQVAACLAGFIGESEQLPPMYSALKRDGKPLYEYARAGIEVERKPRRIVISEISLESDLTDGRFAFSVRCSKGTYVRTLAADIGERLGCGAHLAGLRRTAIGPLELEQAHTLDQLEVATDAERGRLLLPPDALLASLPEARLSAGDASRLRHGQTVAWNGEALGRVRVYDAVGEFLGLGEAVVGAGLRPRRLVATSGGA